MLPAVSALILLAAGSPASEGASAQRHGSYLRSCYGLQRLLAGIRVQIVIRAGQCSHPGSIRSFLEPDGRFSFHRVPAGTYSVQASIDGEVFERDERPDGTSVGLRFSEAPGDLEADFPIPAHPTIRGVGRDEFGDPASKVIVSAVRYWWNDGRLNRVQFTRTTSDDLGQYRLTNLKPGLYTICAKNRPT